MAIRLREIKSENSIDNSMEINDKVLDTNEKRDANGEPLKKKRKPRAKKLNKLTKEEVRRNHVSSEKKRRELVRTTYDELVKMIPDLQPSENRSEMVIYLKTINHLNWLYGNNKRLCGQLEEKYRELGKDDYRIPEDLMWELKSDVDSATLFDERGKDGGGSSSSGSSGTSTDN